MKQKIKKLTDKIEKVGNLEFLVCWVHVNLHIFLPIQDSSKMEDLKKESENSTALIPKLEANIPELQKLLVEEEKVLDEVVENSKGGTSNYYYYYYFFFWVFCCSWRVVYLSFCIEEIIYAIALLMLGYDRCGWATRF